MSENLQHTIFLGLAFLLLFSSAEWLYHKIKIHGEITRKYVHVMTGLLTMLFPLLIESHWYVLALCACFLIILWISLVFKLLPSINAVGRKSTGSLLYPIVVYGCYLVYTSYSHYIYYYIPLVILALCDPLAALIGKTWPLGTYTTFGHTKTMSGTMSFFVLAIGLSLLFIITLQGSSVQHAIFPAICIALFTALAEAITHRGFDNITIPLAALVVLLIQSYIS